MEKLSRADVLTLEERVLGPEAAGVSRGEGAGELDHESWPVGHDGPRRGDTAVAVYLLRPSFDEDEHSHGVDPLAAETGVSS